MIRQLGIQVQLYDYLERLATDKQRKQGLDIADFLLDIETEEGKFEQMKRTNQSVAKLANLLKLQPVKEAVVKTSGCMNAKTF